MHHMITFIAVKKLRKCYGFVIDSFKIQSEFTTPKRDTKSKLKGMWKGVHERDTFSVKDVVV